MQLILCRHAECGSNVLPVFDSHPPGAPLTDTGHQQAAGLATKLASGPVTAIYSSDLQRAVDTAGALGELVEVPVTASPGLREWHAGALEGRGDQESLATFHGLYDAWISGDMDLSLAGGESARDVVERFDAVVRAAEAAGGERAVIFSHGVAIRLWVYHMARNASSRVVRALLPNCGSLVLEGDSLRRWELTTPAHIPSGSSDGLSTPRKG
jgi:broad specificity phosphatase PhoE